MDRQWSSSENAKPRKRKGEVNLKCADGSEVTACFYFWENLRLGKRTVKVPVFNFEAFDWIVKDIEHRRKHGFDEILSITGDERVGKSTLAAHFAYRFGFRDVSKITFNSMQSLNAIEAAEEGGVVWLDEAGVALYSDEYFRREERNLIKALQLVGAKQLIFILCLPHKNILAKKIRERRVTHWIDCYTMGEQRGWARLRIPKKSEFHLDSWWTPQFSFHFPEFGTYKPYKSDGFDPAKFWADYFGQKLLRMQGELDEYAGKTELKHREKLARGIIELKKTGKSWREISNAIGFDPEYCRMLAKDAVNLSYPQILPHAYRRRGRKYPQAEDRTTPPSPSNREHLRL